MRPLAPPEPEPTFDQEHLARARELGLFPGFHLANVALKRTEWRRRQRLVSRLWRRWTGEPKP